MIRRGHWASVVGGLGLCFLFGSSIALAGSSGAAMLFGPARVGGTVRKPFLYKLPSQNVEHFSAAGLPPGLELDPLTGVIQGLPEHVGEYRVPVTAKGAHGEPEARREIQFVIGENTLRPSIALTPPMGWNTWNVYGCKYDQELIRKTADLMVSTGLASRGYQYIVLDDCWQGGRDSAGRIHPDLKRFPDIQGLAAYVHGLGLKFGLYSSPGLRICKDYTGSRGHELQDAQIYAEWGVDYLKYDWCDADLERISAYRKMGEALRATGRDIVYSLSQYGRDDVWNWGAQLGANLWRVSGDIGDSWSRVVRNQKAAMNHFGSAGPGHWNDPDFLELGVIGLGRGKPHAVNLTHEEQRSHLTLWAMMAAPLMLSADLSQLEQDPWTLETLLNEDLIAIDQDILGRQGRLISSDQGKEIWTRELSDGMAVAFLNRNPTPARIQPQWSTLGLGSPLSTSVRVRDVWAHGADSKFLPASDDAIELQPHESILLKFSSTENQLTRLDRR